MSPCSMVSDLRLRLGGWRICLMVVILFIEKSEDRNEQFTLVLSDERGSRIVAIIPGLIWKAFKGMTCEGKWLYIGDFRVEKDRRAIKLTPHKLCIHFHCDTVIERTKKKTRMSIYSFSTFAQILGNSIFHGLRVVDMFGVVVKVGKLIVDEAVDEDRDLDSKYTLEFTLRDLSGQDIRCVALGRSAVEFEVMWQHQPIGQKCISVLRFWKVMVCEDAIWLTSGGEFSELNFDNPIEEVANFRNMLDDGSVGSDMIEDAYIDCPYRQRY